MSKNIKIKDGKGNLIIAAILTAIATLKVAIGLASKNKKWKYFLYIIALIEFVFACLNAYRVAYINFSPITEDDELSDDLSEEDFFDEDEIIDKDIEEEE